MHSEVGAVYAFTGAFVDELVRAGVRHACVCPGSRSTPLALSLASQPGMRVWVHLDERSAAFFALGMAKESGSPTVLVCTSGTAAVNFMPAIVEAKHSEVPLLVLTADRPPELHEYGAAQTIDQLRLYGAQVKWSVEMPLPEASDALLRFARTTAARAAATAMAGAAGPVHLNFPFREPLIPAADELPALSHTAVHGRADRAPYVRVVPSAAQAPDHATLERLQGEFSRTGRGLIVCGPMEWEIHTAEAIASLARAFGYPILADPLSGLRCGPHDRSLLIDAYDGMLRVDRFVELAAPDVILRFGAMPTAKPALQFMQRYPEARQILVEATAWRDPTHLSSEIVHADPAQLCRALAAGVRPSAPSEWTTLWLEANRRARQAIDRQISLMEDPCEPRAMAELSDLLPDGSVLFAGNSMPVRDIDTFFHSSDRAVRIVGSRGASGIDGVTSTALGVAALHGGPVVLAIGDISFYHDLNGLLAAKQYGLNLTVVLLNNEGGGIFSFLPQSSLPRDAQGAPFELLFGTPHHLNFANAAALYGAEYTRVASWQQYRDTVSRALRDGGLQIIEVPSEREGNVALHRRVWPAVAAALAEIDL